MHRGLQTYWRASFKGRRSGTRGRSQCVLAKKWRSILNTYYPSARMRSEGYGTWFVHILIYRDWKRIMCARSRWTLLCAPSALLRLTLTAVQFLAPQQKREVVFATENVEIPSVSEQERGEHQGKSLSDVRDTFFSHVYRCVRNLPCSFSHR